MDSESAKTEAVGAGPDMRKTLASVIITEKATAEPCVVMNALIRCLQVPEVGPPRPQPLLGAQRLWPLVRPPAAQHTGAGLGAGVQRGAGRGESLLLEDAGEPGVFTISKSSSDTVGLGALLLEQEQSRRTCGSKDRADQSSGTPGHWGGLGHRVSKGVMGAEAGPRGAGMGLDYSFGGLVKTQIAGPP